MASIVIIREKPLNNTYQKKKKGVIHLKKHLKLRLTFWLVIQKNIQHLYGIVFGMVNIFPIFSTEAQSFWFS